MTVSSYLSQFNCWLNDLRSATSSEDSTPSKKSKTPPESYHPHEHHPREYGTRQQEEGLGAAGQQQAGGSRRRSQGPFLNFSEDEFDLSGLYNFAWIVPTDFIQE